MNEAIPAIDFDITKLDALIRIVTTPRVHFAVLSCVPDSLIYSFLERFGTREDLEFILSKEFLHSPVP